MRREIGQTAVEYLTVFSAALVFIAVATTAQMIDPGKEHAQNSLYLSQARAAADSIAEAIDTVYANGPGAVKSIGIQMDTGWKLYLDNLENSVKVEVTLSDSSENLESSLYYPLDNYHSAVVFSGFCTVIVEWSTASGASEGLQVDQENDRVLITLVR